MGQQNIVTFIIDLKDQFANPMSKIKSAAIGGAYTVDQLTDANKKLKESIGKSAGSLSDLRSKISALKQTKELIPISATKQMHELNKEIGKLQKAVDKADGTKKHGGFAKLFEGIPKVLPIAAVGLGIAEMLKGSMEDKKQKIEFKNLFGDKAGDSLHAQMKKLKTVLGDGVMDLGKEMALAGEPLANVSEKIHRLGDVASGDQTKLQSLVNAFSQLRKDGKLTEGTLNSLETGGFKPLVLMSQQTGQSLARLRERFSAGKISAKMVEDALRKSTDAGGQFYGNLKRMEESPSWEKMFNKIKELGSYFGDILMPIAMPVIDLITEGVGLLAEGIRITVEWMKPLAKWTKENADMLAVLAGGIGAVVLSVKAVTIAKTAWLAVTGGLTAAIEFMSAAIMAIPVFGWILAAIAAIVAAVIYMRSHFEGFGTFFKNLWEQNKAAFSIFVSFIKQGFEWIGYHIKKNWLQFKMFGQYIAGLFSNVGNALKLAMQFKFSEAKNALTADITTGASGEISNLEKEHAENQKYYERERLLEGFKILAHPLEGIIKRKKEGEESAAEAAVGDGIDKGKGPPPKGFKSWEEWYAAQGGGSNINAGINAISGGGTKNITITIGKMLDNVTFHIQNGSKQLAQELEKVVEEVLVRTLASASAR